MKDDRIPEGLRRLVAQLGKLKYAALVIVLGIVLLLWPSDQTADATPAQADEADVTEAGAQDMVSALEQRLSALLSQLDGAGETSVLLTLQSGTRTVYAADTDQSYTEGILTSQTQQVVLYDSGNGLETPLAEQEIYPTFQGALVLCQGADDAAVRLDIVNAISGLTGLGADKITVIKMKES